MATAAKLATMPTSKPSGRIEPGDVLTPTDLAKRLQVKVSWVYKQAERRGPDSLPVLRCGGYLRFCWPEVCAWLREKKG